MSNLRVLQIGCGGFGPCHIEAWRRLGHAEHLIVADPDEAGRARAAQAGLPASRIFCDFAAVLDRVDVVDVVVPTDLHVDICLAALGAGKDVFCEKPLTLDPVDARAVAAAVEAGGRVLQVGYYFRHHPLARFARDRLDEAALGELRYLCASFTGFKRARRDSGALGNDAIHFFDLFNWWIGATPCQVYALTRDHFGRGFDDLAIVLLTYPNGLVARVEAGYIQPGRWVDDIVPGAQATKEATICGALGALEIDFHSQRLIWHRVRHERHADGLFRPRFEAASMPHHTPMTPVEIVASQLDSFLGHVARRSRPDADALRAGVAMADLYAAIVRSATSNQPVALGSP
jgi:predicted dehydrogenase